MVVKIARFRRGRALKALLLPGGANQSRSELWFSPLLVMFQDARPVPAMLLSLHACLKKIPAFLLHVAAIFVAVLVTLIPFGLGLLILVPTVFGSIYACYLYSLWEASNRTPRSGACADWRNCSCMAYK
jgi:hypothetical protein